MTKSQHLSWSPTPPVHHHHHRHRHNKEGRPQFIPLHRSLTDEESYADKPSPITRFVSKLLGLAGSSSRHKRPPLTHKSHSTTSITKGGSVISSASSTTQSTNDKTAVSIIDWTSHHDYQHQHQSRSRSNSCSSTTSTSTSDTASSIRSHRSTCSENCCRCGASSPAVHALVSAATQLEQQEEERKKRQQKLVASLDIMDPPKLVDRRADTEPVLNTKVAEQLRPYLPRRYRLATQWSLLYSLDQHGTSLTTLYRLVKANKGPCILAIKDADDNIFGAFLNETLKTNNTSYYGTGECFLWKFGRAGGIKVFPWTGKNEYMILSEADFIAIGGGDGKFGLWINSDLEKGHTEKCPTFDNEALTTQPEFACIELEVWGFRI